MKKNLLFLGLLGLAFNSYAQQTNLGPWVEVNTQNTNAFVPGFRITDVKTVSANVAWIVARENTTNSLSNYAFVTNNAAGDQFNFASTIPTVGTQTLTTGNISPVGLPGTPAASTTAIAATYPRTGAGGEIIRTTDGGQSWNAVTSAAQFNGNNNGFCDFVHMFNATTGIAFGDPTNNSFEILRTTDGGVTWTRLPAASSPAPLTGEAGLTRSFFALGNTIWAGTGSTDEFAPVRVLRSTDQGLTWTASPVTALLGGITRLAFKDAQNGIAFNTKDDGNATSEVNMIRTSDGGATWQPITPVNNATGSFYYYEIDAVNGRYYSSGQRFPSARANADFGFSTSTDGINWTNIVSGGAEFFAFDLIPGTATGSAVGYAGLQTDAAGVGGIYKTASAIVAASRDAALQSVLSVYPNPGTGVFSVDLGANLKAGAELTVSDALGRRVKAQTLNAATVGARKLTLDLTGEKTGIYTLQIRTEAGIATQKVALN